MSRQDLMRRVLRLEAAEPFDRQATYIMSSVPEGEMPADSNYRRWVQDGLAELNGRVVYFHGGHPEPMTADEWAAEYVTAG